MEESIQGLALIIGALGIMVTFAIFLLRMVYSITEKVGELKAKMEDLCNRVKSLNDTNDKLHPRS